MNTKFHETKELECLKLQEFFTLHFLSIALGQ